MIHTLETISFEEIEKAALVILRTNDSSEVLNFCNACRTIPVPAGKRLPALPIAVLDPDTSVALMDERQMNQAGWFRRKNE